MVQKRIFPDVFSMSLQPCAGDARHSAMTAGRVIQGRVGQPFQAAIQFSSDIAGLRPV
jgi:hypothetical protein